MDTIRLKRSDIIQACRTLLLHLNANANFPGELLPANQWLELCIDQGDELGTRTLVKADTFEYILQIVTACESDQDALCKLGFDHVTLELWEAKVSKTDTFRLFTELTAVIPENHFIGNGSLQQAPDGSFIVCKEYMDEETINYKNELAYVFFMDFPAYAGEMYEETEYNTRRDFLAYNKPDGQLNSAILMFDVVRWESPETLYQRIHEDEDE